MPRKQKIPIESSWRVVEGGENDSFDTSILRDTDDELVLSSGNPSQLSQTQLSGSQPFSIGGSQDDNLQSFLTKAEKDEQVIMRSPFRPSVPQSVRQSSRDNMKHRSPEPEFRFPTLDVDSPRRPGVSTRSSSSRTARPGDSSGTRRRQIDSGGSPTKNRRRQEVDYSDEGPRGFGERLGEALPEALFKILAWFLGVIGMAFSYAQKPLAILLAVYFAFGGLIIAQNMATRSLYASLSPICRIPGVSYLDLPFCPTLVPKDGTNQPGDKPVEFDGLMNVQERFEEVLEKSAQGVSLPMEMKRSEASVRDLRTMVRYSSLQGKEELVLEFDGFIDAAKTASNDLQRFNTHVGSAVDSVISINRWTSRYLDGLAAERQGRGWVERWAGWAFAPFQPAVFSERMLLDKYVEHTALVSDKIGDLIVEAQAVLRTLSKAEDHLGIIYDFVTRTQKSVQTRKDEILWTLWTLVGANTRHIHNLNSQLSLLRQVDGQRAGAVQQVSELIVELEKIQAGLGDLRDRVAEPELVRGRIEVPLSVHIETIDKGVERLEMARSRIRALENERIREVLARGKGEERLIDSS
ncbi:hypothetical protein CONLIGDRAFT_126250 [Coniochaeta ligniaria NRRL 30616]|uniref:Uncharacterized protein n=1 Tax=Coniochaeta ligniaria NRRL 30616 TaxID=1408157 RepID=A0A1J7I9I4_9PEZI|nr:hypothetical protein CONLIGDRAFT_126250 [Coniochaeta ligniaria NRRL 30616]